jgi:hypothetical protein
MVSGRRGVRWQSPPLAADAPPPALTAPRLLTAAALPEAAVATAAHTLFSAATVYAVGLYGVTLASTRTALVSLRGRPPPPLHEY